MRCTVHPTAGNTDVCCGYLGRIISAGLIFVDHQNMIRIGHGRGLRIVRISLLVNLIHILGKGFCK